MGYSIHCNRSSRAENSITQWVDFLSLHTKELLLQRDFLIDRGPEEGFHPCFHTLKPQTLANALVGQWERSGWKIQIYPLAVSLMIGLWRQIYDLCKTFSDFSITGDIRNILEYLSVANFRVRTSRSSRNANS